MSSAFLTKDNANKLTPILVAVIKSSLSLSVNALADKPPPCLLIPLLFDKGPATVTSHITFFPATSLTLKTILPSSNNKISPGATSCGKVG